ncbi:nuclear receptor-interacting protein 1 [Hyperolius riggenbachi]|uniref:nuclear receptor-interacting protein 1 n=1 Tax=Hyperolius riggenbachi TaxID=752182 RepID=UPI0035A383D2
MTHGEELSSEKQQDSIVLTYLEGLLMHQAASGSGTAVDKLSVGRVKVDESFKISGNGFNNCKDNASIHNSSQGSSVLHLKKARLLQSSEDWTAAKKRRLTDPNGVNGKSDSLLTGMVDSVPKGKQDSTLLASLLQSFSSRLQTVALSQQIKQTLKDQGFPIAQDTAHEEKDDQCYGLASNHLKALLNKSRSKDKIVENNLTVLAKNSLPEKYVEPPKGTGESISCAARLQAVANMVEKRSSPTASPKPSVACSQLALLLSSEAHLQQYSREHALKAQSASQLASERLAAMARIKESTEKDIGQFQLSANVSNNLNSHPRTITNGLNSPGNVSPFSSQLGVPSSPLRSVTYKNHVDKNHPKSLPNNSLLLHLLKSQNGSTVGNSHAHNEKYAMFEESATPTTTDDFSDHNPSFTEEESSDDESTHSNCVPIDLSFKNRADKPEILHSAASIDNLTESLLKNWDPKVNGLDHIKENKDSSVNSTLKPYQKVTLLQLLLGHKMDDSPPIMEDPRTPQKTTDLSNFNLTPPVRLSESPIIHNTSPLNTLSLHRSTTSASPLNLTHQPFPVKPNFPSYVSSIQADRLVNPASKHLIELTRSKGIPTSAPPPNDNAQTNAAFSASKLLQNLAQCGKPSATPEEQRPHKPASTINSGGLIDKLNSPLMANPSNTFDEGRSFSSPPTPIDSRISGSEIENLLERRTVLQLLLAAPNKCKNEKVKKPIVKDEVMPDRTDDMANEQFVSLKVKMEPQDDSGIHQTKEPNALNTLGVSLLKPPRPVLEDIKPLYAPPQDFSVSKNGLLSRLLRQNDVFDHNDLDLNNRHFETKPGESKMSSIVPKKRKMHQNDPLENQAKVMKPSTPDIGIKQFCTAPSSRELPFLHEEMDSTKTEQDQRNFTAQNAFNENKNVGWSRESKGFNVLKQLLLSENCVRDSQHRNNAMVEELMRGNRTNLAGSPEFILPPLNMFMGKAPPQNSFGHVTFQYPSPLKNTPHSSPDILRNNSPRSEVGHIGMCPNPNDRAPTKWVIADHEKNERGKDSPRLTKTNPILYYMLQKGAQSASGQDLHDRTSWAETLLGQAAEMTLKRESLYATGTSGFGFNKPSNNNVNTFHNSNGSQYGLFDMLTIKKEPE